MYYKLVVLFVKYNEEKYPNSLHYLQKYLSKIKQNEVQIIIIDNKVEKNYPKRLEDYYYDEPITITGDNSCWEFSAWDKGLQYLKENNIDYDAILFVNDSFLAPSGYDSPLTVISDENIFYCVKNESFIGNIVNSGKFKIGKYSTNKHMRTHCFMLSKKVIESIKKIVTIDNDFIDKCISKVKNKFYFLKNAPICTETKLSLVNNLTKNWHSAFNIYDNWDLFRMKSMAMLNEMTLLSRIESIIEVTGTQKDLKDIINSIPNNKKIVCVGASTNARVMMEKSDLPKKKVVAFLDNYVRGKINEIPIYTPEEFKELNIYYDYMVFLMFQPESIKPQLLSLGYKIKEFGD